MALAATVVGEVNAAADSANNGAFFDASIANAGTDYSQNTTAILTASDAVCTASSATITSATSTFTSAMTGNGLYISSGANAGYYIVTTFTDANTITVDRTLGSNQTGTPIKIGGASSNLTDALCEAAVGGNVIHVKSGSYTLTAAITIGSTAGESATPIRLSGYKTTRGDRPKGTDRPAISGGAYQITINEYWILENLDMTSTAAGTLSAGSTVYNQIENCKIYNTSGSANQIALVVYSTTHLKHSEVKCTNGYAITILTNAQTYVYRSYIHDSVIGIRCTSSGRISCFQVVIDTCSTTGFDAATSAHGSLIQSTVYNCGTGMSLSATGITAIDQVIFHSNTTAISAPSANKVTKPQYCVFYNNGTNSASSYIELDGTNVINTDPYLKDPANGDFTINNANSLALSSGPLGTDIGLVGDYKWKIGAFQGCLNTPVTASAGL